VRSIWRAVHLIRSVAPGAGGVNVTTGCQIAVPIVSAEIPLAQQVRAAAAAGAGLVELRVDCIGDADAAARLLREPHPLPYILTVRARDEGGAWAGDEAERIALIERLGLLRPEYIDVELATWRRSANIRQKIGLVCEVEGDTVDGARVMRRGRSQLILSHHDFRATPEDVGAVFDALAATPAAVVKAVFTARDARDAFRVLDELRQRSARRPMIALTMGPAGLATRVLAGKFGAWLTFAALEAGEASAPGQPTVGELRERYGWERIGPATRVYGVVGWPVAHSRGPELHNAAMARAGCDGVYLPLPVGPDEGDFAAFMATIASAELGVAGLSVTLPHKEHALRWLDAQGLRVSALARQCGAVNTLTRAVGGTWEGDNTDAPGALAALAQTARYADGRLDGAQVAVLGAGGVARAVVAALVSRECRVTVYNRDRQRAESLAQELRCAAADWEERAAYVGDVLVNCTSVGLWPRVAETPLPKEWLRPNTVVFDTVYQPAETRLLREARECGCEIVSGWAMFLGQGRLQFANWHGAAASASFMGGSQS
jgi:3-dehydroquinate dehydratase/shikimate dehydrogenase